MIEEMQINHMPYIDDLKLFTKSGAQLNNLLHTVHMFSCDVCLSFGFDKCSNCSVTRGKIITSDDISLPDGCRKRTSVEYW